VPPLNVTAEPKKSLIGIDANSQRRLLVELPKPRPIIHPVSGHHVLESVMTPHDCRAMADQCFQGVHDAKSVDERRAYLKLAHVWLEAALDEDHALPTMPPAPSLQIIRAQALVDHAPQLR
jgi:hypothetical protein